MYLHLDPPKLRQEGSLDVHVNGSGMKTGHDPYAVIQLDENGSIELSMDTPGEIDRLIAAATEAKRLLLAATERHAYQPSDPHGGRCTECGVSKGHHLWQDEAEGNAK